MRVRTTVKNQYMGKATDLADVLTADNALVRCMGRLAACGMTEAVTKWVEAEVERDTDMADILYVLSLMQIQLLASLVGSAMKPSGFGDFEGAFIALIGDTFTKHATAVSSGIDA